MDVKFDLVRIGNARKNYTSEKILKQNVDLLRKNIRELLRNENCSHKNNREDITMIVPARGFNIKIRLQDVKDYHIRKLLRDKFPNSMYKGKLDTILDNSNNRVFR
ncbi:MAG: hypothetical protein R3342_13170 [Lutibacter sp.]|uniref:hypothetical protein n=1 Tax=Lutibacter sp. TaxID=1925666 RepID=UPI00299EFB5F|nr:hypothetical protein [Lutibacter sp.]MDX1830484.1 hypothetical protein [Lutibacter sp.]